jgi:thiol-disulfide isomerase/thioredoxin
MLMTRGWFNGLALLAAGVGTCGQVISAAERDEASKAARVRLLAKMPGPRADEPMPAKTIAQQFTAIRAEYDAAEKTASAEAEKGKSEFESWKIFGKLMPDQAAFSRRMVDLAASEPQSPAARDALLWVIDKPGMGTGGAYSDEFTRAVLLLLRYQADDPEVARVALGLDNTCSPARDLFLGGLYVRAKGHEAKGLATVALGQYLEMKAKTAAALRNVKGPAQKKMRVQTFDEGGRFIEKEFDIPQEDQAYQLHLRMSDPEAIRTEAGRLFDEVIRDYGAIPYLTRRFLKLQELLKQPTPSWNGRPLTPDERKQAERMLAHKKTLADVARAKIDEMENLVAGKPAPAIDGIGMDGKSLKLSDYRGKVVVLVFWGTWCGPCMQEVPHERELAERYKGRPFAFLGVDCESNKAAALKVMKDQGITWPNWNDGDPGEGPIAQTYHVRGYPTTFVIDARGVIRHQYLLGSGLDKAVEDLIKEAETTVVGK